MHNELLFNKENEKVTEDKFSKYMTMATGIIRAAEQGSTEYSDAEIKELTDYVIKLAVDRMEWSLRNQYMLTNQFEDEKEDFITNFKILILRDIKTFNDPDHLTADGKQYCFSTFLKTLSQQAITMTYADIHCVSVDIEKKFNAVTKAARRIASQKQISLDRVQPEMVKEVFPKLSVYDIKAILDRNKAFASVEQMTDDDGIEIEAFKDKDNIDTNIFDVLDVDVQKLLDAYYNKLSLEDKFFFFKACNCIESKYFNMTMTELSCEKIFLYIVEASGNGDKNIVTEDVIIQRPNRSTGNDVEPIVLKNIRHVKTKHIDNQVTKAKRNLKSIEDSLNMGDLVGNCGVNYVLDKWNEFVSTCEK